MHLACVPVAAERIGRPRLGVERLVVDARRARRPSAPAARRGSRSAGRRSRGRRCAAALAASATSVTRRPRRARRRAAAARAAGACAGCRASRPTRSSTRLTAGERCGCETTAVPTQPATDAGERRHDGARSCRCRTRSARATTNAASAEHADAERRPAMPEAQRDQRRDGGRAAARAATSSQLGAAPCSGKPRSAVSIAAAWISGPRHQRRRRSSRSRCRSWPRGAVAPTTTILPRTAAASKSPVLDVGEAERRESCPAGRGSRSSASLPAGVWTACARAPASRRRARSCRSFASANGIRRTGRARRPVVVGEEARVGGRRPAVLRAPRRRRRSSSCRPALTSAVPSTILSARRAPPRSSALSASASSLSLGELEVVGDDAGAGLRQLLDHLGVALAVERQRVRWSALRASCRRRRR